jgi:CAAX protease family protein
MVEPCGPGGRIGKQMHANVDSTGEARAPGRESAASRLRGRLTWQRVPVGRIRILRPQPELMALLAYALLVIVGSAVTGLLIRRHPLPILGASYFTHDVQYTVLFKFIGLLVLPAIWFFRSGYAVRDLLPEWRLTARTGAFVLLAFCLGAYINQWHVPGIRLAVQKFDAGALALRLLLGCAIPLFTAGIPEEFVYRGLLQTRLELLAGRRIAVLVTALLFTAWHLPSRWLLATGAEGTAGDPVSVLMNTGLPVFMVALVLGWLWDRYRSLVPLIALHWGIDLLPSLSAMLAVPMGGPHR